MASRSRFSELKNLRASAKALRSGQWEPLPTSEVDGDQIHSGTECGLYGDQSSSLYTEETVIDVTPEWARIVDLMNHTFQKINEKLVEFKGLQKQQLLPGFDDSQSGEKNLAEISHQITSLLQECHSNLKRLGAIPKNETITQEERLLANARVGLAKKLQTITFTFKRLQSDYLKELRALEERQPSSAAGFTLLDEEKRRLAIALSDDDNDNDNAFSMLSPQELQQKQATMTSDIQQTGRQKAIHELIQSVYELSEMVRFCHEMVTQQGTVLDRIDRNIEMAKDNVSSGLVHLINLEESEKRGILAICIHIEFTIVIGLIIILFLKLLYRHFS